MKKLVSIIIPIYNMENYLDRCLNSIVTQSYTNLEVILVDDGSKDTSLSICYAWKKKDARVKVIHKENGGVSSARNAGLIEAKGEYIAFIDPDDWVETEMYSTLVRDIEENHADAAFCNFFFVNENNEKKVSVKSDSTICVDRDEAAFYSIAWTFQGGGYYTSIWNKLYRKEILFNQNHQMLMFDSEYLIGEDELWLMNILKHCKKVVLDHRPLYNYLWLRKDGASSVKKFSKHRLDEARTKIETVKIIKEMGLSQKTLNVAQANLVDVLSSFLVVYNKDLNYSQRKIFLKEINDNISGWKNFYRVSFWGRIKKKTVLVMIRLRLPARWSLDVNNLK